ncbi:hypothetical protein D3C87_459880 [compost metagenome]
MRHWKYYLRFLGNFVLEMFLLFLMFSAFIWTYVSFTDVKIPPLNFCLGFMGILVINLFFSKYNNWEGKHKPPKDWIVTLKINGWEQRVHPTAYSREEAVRKAIKYMHDWHYAENRNLNSIALVEAVHK